MFGDVLPDVTRDEAADPDPAEARAAEAGSSAAGPGTAGADPQDAWLRANRPPHHDRD